MRKRSFYILWLLALAWVFLFGAFCLSAAYVLGFITLFALLLAIVQVVILMIALSDYKKSGSIKYMLWIPILTLVVIVCIYSGGPYNDP